MNKQLKQFAEQAGIEWVEMIQTWLSDDAEIERFAELVRQDEREACAKLCEDEHKLRLAETIRARGNT
jgi:hypothetical protein